MRIAWFTPFSKKSAIARCSEAIVTELSQLASVDVWHSDTDDIRPTKLRTVRFSQAGKVDFKKLSGYDLVVYNLGNHFPFHGEIFQVAQQCPGICILHDHVMHHFFAAYYLEYMKSQQGYTSAVDRLYGDRARTIADAALSGNGNHLWESDDVVRYPFFEDAIRGSYGVVTHSDFLREAVRKAYPGPVCKIHLAYDATLGAPVFSRSDLGISESDVLIVTIGHVNPNKRIHAVIEALAQLGASAAGVCYAVLGPYDAVYHDQLRAKVWQHGMQKAVRFLGYASDEVLQSYLVHSDICVNLRFPAMEGASASVIEEMQYGKPVIVTDTGFFNELPQDCVSKIHPDREAQDLPLALKKLIADRGFREELGYKGREFAEEHFRPARYAKEFLQFAWEARRSKPLLQLADRLAEELRRMGVHQGMEVVERVSAHCGDIFCALPQEKPAPR